MERVPILFFLMLCSAIFVSCSGKYTDSKGNEEAVVQELTYLTSKKVVGLSPILVTDIVSKDIMDQIYETLFIRNNDTGEIEPFLARSSRLIDENNWEITLRDDVYFHDGSKFNAEAVKYTFDKIINPATGSPRSALFEGVIGVSVDSEYTIVIKTEVPYGSLLAALTQTNTAIVSPEADQKGNLMLEPVGTGPFCFDKIDQSGIMVFKKNRNYWRDEAKLDFFKVQTVPDDNTLLSMLAVDPGKFTVHVSPKLIPAIERYDQLILETIPGTQSYYLIFNKNSQITNDIQFRNLISQGINSKDIIEKYNNTAYYFQGVIGPHVKGHNPDINNIILEKKPNDFIKQNSYEKTKLRLIAAKLPYYEMSAEIIQSQLEQIGFQVELSLLEWGVFVDEVGKGNFDLMLSAWFNTSGEADEFFYLRFHSRFINGTNQGGYQSEVLDGLIKDVRETINDEERWKKIISIEEQLINDSEIVPLFHTKGTIVHDRNTFGIKMDQTGRWSLYEVSRK